MCKRDAETVKVWSKTQEATSNHRNAYHTWCKVNQRKRRRRKKPKKMMVVLLQKEQKRASKWMDRLLSISSGQYQQRFEDAKQLHWTAKKSWIQFSSIIMFEWVLLMALLNIFSQIKCDERKPHFSGYYIKIWNVHRLHFYEIANSAGIVPFHWVDLAP